MPMCCVVRHVRHQGHSQSLTPGWSGKERFLNPTREGPGYAFVRHCIIAKLCTCNARSRVSRTTCNPSTQLRILNHNLRAKVRHFFYMFFSQSLVWSPLWQQPGTASVRISHFLGLWPTSRYVSNNHDNIIIIHIIIDTFIGTLFILRISHPRLK